MPALDADQRRKLEAALLLKATEVVAHMRRFAEAGAAEQVEKIAEALDKLVKSKEFPSAHSREFQETSKDVQRGAYQLSVDLLLRQAGEKAHDGDEKARNEVLTKAKEHFSKALRFGADAEFRAAVDRWVQQVMLTSKEGVDDRSKDAARRKLAQTAAAENRKSYSGIERRRARRYGDPALEATVDGLRYVTVNWSTRGLLLEPYRPEAGLYKGQKVKMDLAFPECGARGRQIGRVTRVDESRGVAVDFGEISTLVLDFMHQMRAAGIQPETER